MSSMDSITGFALSLTMIAVAFYALYWVVRKAVAAGIRDARAEHRGAGAAEGDSRG